MKLDELQDRVLDSLAKVSRLIARGWRLTAVRLRVEVRAAPPTDL
jgi:hypothetical protein